MSVPSTWNRALSADVPASVTTTPPSIARSEREYAVPAVITMLVLAPLLTFVAWRAGALAPATRLAHGSVWGTALAAGVTWLVLYLAGGVLLALLLGSTFMLVLRNRGMRNFDNNVLLWARTYAQPEFSHVTSARRARTFLLFCRLWLRGLDDRQLRWFFSLAGETRCTLGELKLLAVKI